MTVASTTNRKTYTGDNVSTSFATSPVIFYLSSNLQVRVTVIATGVSTLLTENTHYTVSGGAATGATGTVSLAGGSSPHGALLSTEKLVILRVLPLTQASDFVNNSNSDAEVLEAALDKLTDVDQQIQEQADRAIRFASGDVSGSVTEVPDVTTRAGRLLGFDTLGVLTTFVLQVGTSLVDLAAAAGSSLIGFIQAGTGAVLRTVQAELRDVIKPKQFGAIGDGVADDSTAVTNTKAAGATPFVPSGTYSIGAGNDFRGLWGAGKILRNGVTFDLPGSPNLSDQKKQKDCSPVFIDLHYGVQRGNSYTAAEINSSWTVTSLATAGSLAVTFTGSVPIAGQLLVWLDASNNYRTAKVQSVAGQVVTLTAPLETNLAAGATVWSWFRNSTHPEIQGTYSIVDAVVNANGTINDPNTQLYSYRRVARFEPVTLAAATVASDVTNDVTKPGSSLATSYVVTPGGAGQGCQWSFVPSDSGLHMLRFRVNTKGVALTVVATISLASGNYDFYNATVTNNHPAVVEIPCWIPRNAGLPMTLKLSRAATAFNVSKVELLRFTGKSINDLNTGKHVLLSDSWGTYVNAFTNRMTARLPNALIVNKSVSGNTSTDLVNRFAADVTPERPDYVWILVGTNDYAAAVAGDLFSYNIQKLKMYCQQIGATPIIFSPSVGDINTGTYFQFSRLYTDAVPYYDEELNLWSPPTTIVVGAYVVVQSDTDIICNGGATTLTLPDPTLCSGRPLAIRTIQAQAIVSASANVVPLIGGAAGTAILAATAGKWAYLKSDGTNWQIMSAN